MARVKIFMTYSNAFIEGISIQIIEGYPPF